MLFEQHTDKSCRNLERGADPNTDLKVEARMRAKHDFMSFSRVFHYFSHRLAREQAASKSSARRKGDRPDTSFSKTVGVSKPTHGCRHLLGCSQGKTLLQGQLPPPWPALGSAACGLLPRDACPSSSSAAVRRPDNCSRQPLPWQGRACVGSNWHRLCWNIGPVLAVSSARGMKGRVPVSPKAKLHPFLSDLANGLCFLGSAFSRGLFRAVSSWVSPFFKCRTPNLTQPSSWDHASAE